MKFHLRLLKSIYSSKTLGVAVSRSHQSSRYTSYWSVLMKGWQFKHFFIDRQGSNTSSERSDWSSRSKRKTLDRIIRTSCMYSSESPTTGNWFPFLLINRHLWYFFLMWIFSEHKVLLLLMLMSALFYILPMSWDYQTGHIAMIQLLFFSHNFPELASFVGVEMDGLF